jgi:hypothetical protein
MTKQVEEAVKELKESVRANTPRVEKRLAEVGCPADPAIVYSVAKYYNTLEKLADE